MYIDKYWGNFIGGSDDSLNLIAFLADQKKEEIHLSEIFAKIGLDKQNWDFRQTVEYLEFTHSDGVEMDFHFAIDVITDLAAILLECSVSGSVDLHDLDEYNTPSRRIRITATAEERNAMDKTLADFAQDPLSYDLHAMMDDEEIQEMARDVEALRKELYTSAPCAFERDENGVFQQIKDWKPEQDEEEPDMDILEQCQKWHENDEYQKIIDAPEAEEQENELEQTLTGMDYIPYTPQNEEEFFQQLERWNDKDKYTRCIQALNAIPEDWRNYRTAYALARALENYAIIGDHDEGTPNYKGDKALLRAIEVLESVKEEGQNKPEWNMRMAYGYQYLHGQEEKAISYAQRWAELDSEDENAEVVIRECRAEIRKRRRSRNKKSKFVPGDTPFEGFDLTNFWDDSMYAQKEYVSEPPSDELIAGVEEELGYKLPASYIWLMKQHNGGIPVNTCYPCDEPTCWAEDHVAITGIFGIGREKSCSLCGELGSQFMIDEWEYPAIGVAICDCPSAGHDMIFLDYRACGPQGEPAVVHVDQENDYKITHLADSFEEFIRGLEHESVYDMDEDTEDFDENEEEAQSGHAGVFAGFVLLSKGEWDKQQFIRDMKEKWDITVEEYDASEEKDDDALVFEVGDMIAAVSLATCPIPNGEAELNAENNYMWEDAVKVARKHCAHIMVAVLGKEEKVLEKGKLWKKFWRRASSTPSWSLPAVVRNMPPAFTPAVWYLSLASTRVLPT